MRIVRAADTYRTTGSRAAAQCAVAQTISLAQEHALTGKMSSSQAYYVQGWGVGAIAIAYLKVRDLNIQTPQQAETIAAWMHSVGEQTETYYDTHKRAGHGDAQNNHLYWAGVELAAIGVTANNRKDFDWAMATYDNGVDQIQPDGSLPLEMARGGRALHYHLYALAPLVLLAEFGEANHLDLYAHADGAIHRLVNFSIAGVKDPASFVRATGVQQEISKTLNGDQIGWAPPYVQRFPNPTLEQIHTIGHKPKRLLPGWSPSEQMKILRFLHLALFAALPVGSCAVAQPSANADPSLEPHLMLTLQDFEARKAIVQREPWAKAAFAALLKEADGYPQDYPK